MQERWKSPPSVGTVYCPLALPAIFAGAARLSHRCPDQSSASHVSSHVTPARFVGFGSEGYGHAPTSANRFLLGLSSIIGGEEGRER
jgi:hypothetical protein